MLSRVSLDTAARFHGHLGPWLVLGLKAGEYAAGRLRVSPFKLRVTVWCGPRPPYSCFLDGTQLGSGCTLGKANLRHIPASGVCRARFSAPRGSLTLTLKASVAAELRAVRSRDADAWGRRLYRRPVSALFTVTARG